MIRKYTHSDFDILKCWIKDAETLFRFSGPDWHFPLTLEQLDVYITRHPLRQFYIGVDEEGTAFAFGEIISGDENSPRLGRMLVGEESKRGLGLGQLFVNDLIEECFRLNAAPKIFLFVFEDNLQAITCYKKCGFEFCNGGHERSDLNGKPVKVLKMEFLK